MLISRDDHSEAVLINLSVDRRFNFNTQKKNGDMEIMYPRP